MISEMYINDKVSSLIEKKAKNKQNLEIKMNRIAIEINYELSKLFAQYQYEIQNKVNDILKKELACFSEYF